MGDVIGKRNKSQNRASLTKINNDTTEKHRSRQEVQTENASTIIMIPRAHLQTLYSILKAVRLKKAKMSSTNQPNIQKYDGGEDEISSNYNNTLFISFH